MSALRLLLVGASASEDVLDAVNAVETTRVSWRGCDLAGFNSLRDLDLDGVIAAMAEFGRSGKAPAAFARLCSAIFSRRAMLVLPPGREVDADMLLTEAWSETFGLLPVSYTHLTLPTKRIV